jgi:23S rRNA (cytosine1962-C5)-methyltransferase
VPRETLDAGASVRIVAPDGSPLGSGFYNAASEITVRRITPPDVPLDVDYLKAAVDRAARLRESIPGLESTDAYRAIHAEGDGLSGLIVDVLGPVLVVELYSAGWLHWLDDLLPILLERFGRSGVRVELSSRVARFEGVKARKFKVGDVPNSVTVHEGEARYRVELSSKHKTGFFCDQRENRADLARWCRGDVLDVCCYTGGFAVSAALGGRADSIVGIDLDEDAIAVAQTNTKLNQVRVNLVHADAFDWLRQVHGAGRRFDTIVVDPPKFIPSRKEEERGRGKYHDLNRLAVSLVKPGGLMLTCSCSGLLSRTDLRELVQTAARKEGRSVAILRETGAAPDHPVLLECPETEYLKALWLSVW